MHNKEVFKAIFLVLVSLLTSCVNLKKVNDYSTNSTRNLNKFEELGYTFVKACNEVCELEQLNKNQLRRAECDCRNEQGADSVTFAIYTAVKGYFEGITKLSDNELTDYKFDALTKSLKEGDFGGVTISKDHVDSYAKISSILTRAVTDEFRKRKLSTYIGEGNDAIKVLLNKLEFNLVSNLSKRLESRKQMLESYYFDLANDANASAYEKKKIIEEYSEALADLRARKEKIAVFGKGLSAIAAGHQKLFENRNKLDAKSIKELLTRYTSDIQDVVDEFNKLKNQD